MGSLPKPVIVESYLADVCQPPLPAFRLRWDPDSPGAADRTWHLPDHLTLKGPAPERFGLDIVRSAADAYTVRLLWNGMYLSWGRLTRVQLLTSALSPVLRALGQDLWQLLHQPPRSDAGCGANAA